jgi:hypothetical protein
LFVVVEEVESQNKLKTWMGKIGESGDHRLGKGGERDDESQVSKMVAPI